MLSDDTPDSSSARSRSIFCRLVSLMISIVEDAESFGYSINTGFDLYVKSRYDA